MQNFLKIKYAGAVWGYPEFRKKDQFPFDLTDGMLHVR
jgi:hypothetical protein